MFFKMTNVLRDEAESAGGVGGAVDVDPLAKIAELEAEKEALLAKNRELIGEKKTAREAAEREAAEAEKAREESARKTGDTEALDKSWSEKLSKRERELNEIIDSANRDLNSAIVDTRAEAIASKIAVEPKAAAIIASMLKSRIGVDRRDGKISAIVLDSKGKPSAMTIDELEAEFATENPFLVKKAGASGAAGIKTAPKSVISSSGDDMQERALKLLDNMR